ncbi:MAG TPA: SRPBCC family protein [Verrucomicrobiae bacterium]|nr:SRPBCC family protein [Verrucomicrobiae bacterium]
MRYLYCLMRLHIFETELWLPVSREKVFPFFADARNLEIITPPWLNFRILTPGEIHMRAGALIDYQIRIHGFPVCWRTEITGWNPPFNFRDEQRRGPYRLWRHTHVFEEKDGGTLCRDHVAYSVPGGALVNRLFVRRDVEKIFTYRADALKKHFAKK